MLFNHAELENDYEMGPSTDLVLSLLSVVITILAVVGFGYSAAGINPSSETELIEAQLEIQRLNLQLGQIVSPEPRSVESNIIYGDILELGQATLSIFERNQAQLYESDLPLLKRELEPLYNMLLSSRANILRIQGFASPEPRLSGLDQKLDTNVDLSINRSLVVLHALHRLGVPYRCMVVEGHGRSRSKFLDTYLRQRGMTLEQWDQMYLQGIDQSLLPSQREQLMRELEVLYQQDRRVAVIAAIEAESPCDNDQLVDSINQALFD